MILSVEIFLMLVMWSVSCLSDIDPDSDLDDESVSGGDVNYIDDIQSWRMIFSF